MESIQNIQVAAGLYNRRLENIDLHLKSGAKESFVEREELIISLYNGFIKVLNQQQVNFEHDILPKLNKFIKAFNFDDTYAKRPHTTLELNSRIHRQHALSIISMALEFFLMEGQQKLLP